MKTIALVWLACMVCGLASYLVIRGCIRREAVWTDGDRAVALFAAALGPVGLVIALLIAGISFVESKRWKRPAAW